jgi:YesN/AraC family two-component response regulator
MTSSASGSSAFTLLVIDDEPLILNCFRYLFPASEVRLVTAGSAAEGLRLFAECQPDAGCR